MNTFFDGLEEKVNVIHNKAVSQLEEDKENFLRNLREWGEGPNPYFKEYFPALMKFVELYLEWHTSSDAPSYWKRRMFGDMIPQSEWNDGNVFGPLLHFLSYHVYDDGSFSVKWFKDIYKKESREIDGEIYEFPTTEYLGRVETTPEDYENAYPVLVDDFDGTQDPAVIVDAMLKYTDNQRRYNEEMRNLHEKNQDWLNDNSQSTKVN